MILAQDSRLHGIWPPGAGGSYRNNPQFPQRGYDVLKEVHYYPPANDEKANMALLTEHAGLEHTRDLLLDDAAFAARLASEPRRHLGRTIDEIGGLELNF